MLILLDEVEVFQLWSKDDEIERRLGLQLPGVRVDRVEELERVGGAGDVAQLPVHLVMMVMMMMVVMMVVVMAEQVTLPSCQYTSRSMLAMWKNMSHLAR